jgi:anion-transporting  ArsA/GET3 family ATPase
MSAIETLIDSAKVLLCVGPGGVGKTTTSAALTLLAAAAGRRAIVLTVDPAHRLANALGLQSFKDEEQIITPDMLAKAGVPNGAPFAAMMLDTKRTFDQLIERHTSNPKTRDRILDNPFYVQAATRLAGSQEYMAMEKLYEIHQSGQYDLIVLDTPPTVHALDFLNAPQRLMDFLGHNTSGLLARSSRRIGKLGLGFLEANRLILRGMNKFVGADFFVSVLEFLQDFSVMYDGFKQRADNVKQLLSSSESAFIVLTGPEQASMNEGLFFRDALVEAAMPLGAFVVNRVREPFGPVDKHLAKDFEADVMGEESLSLHRASARKKVSKAALYHFEQYQTLVRRDAANLAKLRDMLGAQVPLISVPDFDQDIHSLAGLYKYGRFLFA